MSVFSALLNNGPLLVGPLADRGAFDQYAQYRPGQVVVDDGVTYLCTAPLGSAVELEDTFDRRDQQGWGQSSHGEVWQTSSDWSAVGPPALQNARGLFSADSATRSDAQLLGPARVRADAELLARLSMVTGAEEDYPGFCLGLNGTEDASQFAQARLVALADGTAHVGIDVASAAGDALTGSDESVPAWVSGQDVWVRLRRVGLVYSATVWPVGTPEPSSPQATETAAHAQPGGHPYVNVASSKDAGALNLGYLSVRALTATDAPADDADHWVALADALQVPQPL